MSATTEITVRDAVPEDAATIAAFNLAMARESEGRELDAGTLSRGVAAVFEDPRRGSYLVAEIDGAIAGSLLTTYEWSDWRDGDLWWIQSVYVVPRHRRRGVFRALYDRVLASARARGRVRGVRLYVERENAVAQDVYRAVGMRESAYRLFETEL